MVMGKINMSIFGIGMLGFLTKIWTLDFRRDMLFFE